MCKRNQKSRLTTGEMSEYNNSNSLSDDDDKEMSNNNNNSNDSISNNDQESNASNSTESQLEALQDKLKRTTKFLHEIQSLSPACEEIQEDMKERQVRRKYLEN